MKKFSQKTTSSWEAVDKDDVGAHRGGASGGGGWVWPERSYPCSFCKREFRSAQALGGHMNVHRRDRALLNQIVISHNNLIIDPSPTSDCCRDHDNYLRIPPKNSHPRGISLPQTRVSSSYYSESSKNSEIKKVVNSTTNDVQVKMCVGLCLDSSSRRRHGNREEEEDEDKLGLSFKRCKKSSGDGILPFLDDFKCSNGKGNPNPQSAKSLDGLDLELRLGLV